MSTRKPATSRAKTHSMRNTTRRNTTRRNATRRNVPAWRRKLVGRGAGILAACILVAATSGFVWYSGWLERASALAQDTVISLSADAGFRVANVLVEGRNRTDRDVLAALVNLRRDDPLFAFDPDVVRERIEGLDWVEAARVERRLPDTVMIRLAERRAMALWQHNRRIALIDTNGAVITRENTGRFSALPLVVGEDAHEHAGRLLSLIAAEPELSAALKTASRIGQRRWDIELATGEPGRTIRAKLPEDDPATAIHMLARLWSEQNLPARDITMIDLRVPERPAVRLAGGRGESRLAPGMLRTGFSAPVSARVSAPGGG